MRRVYPDAQISDVIRPVLNELDLPVTLKTRGSVIVLRRAGLDDIDSLVALLAGDPISASRGDIADDADLPAYRSALTSIIDDGNNELVVASDQISKVIAAFEK